METDEEGFLSLYRAGSIKRWHTRTTIKEQDLAAHSWGVAMIVDYLGGAPNVIKAALYHDMAEWVTGDIPYQVKQANMKLDQEIKKIEAAFDETYGLELHLSPSEIRLLKWADMFELLLWTKREIRLGNLGLNDAHATAVRTLEYLGAPNDRADNLLQEVLRNG